MISPADAATAPDAPDAARVAEPAVERAGVGRRLARGTWAFVKGVARNQAALWSYPFRSPVALHVAILAAGAAMIIGVLAVADAPVMAFLRLHLSMPWREGSERLSDVGQLTVAWVVPPALWLAGTFVRRSLLAVAGRSATLAVVSSGLMVQVLKNLFGRIRPYRPMAGSFLGPAGDLHGKVHGFGSFPSGHAAVAFAAATVLAGCTSCRWTRAGLVLAATVVGVLRITGAQHFPSDVLAGAALGWGAGLLALRERPPGVC